MSVAEPWLAVATGGFIGGIGRYLLGKCLPRYAGTLAANTIACLLLGAVTKSGLDGWALVLFSAGIAGALSTWSTLSKELGGLLKQRWQKAVLYLVVTLICGLSAIVLGMQFGAWIT